MGPLNRKPTRRVGFPGHSKVSSLVDAGAFLKNPRRYEDQQFGLVVRPLLAAEQHTSKRNVTKERYLTDCLTALCLVDATKNHRLAISNEHLGLNGARIDTWNRTAKSASRNDFADIILADHEVHEDVVIRRNLWSNRQLENRFLELNRGCA